jgi:hypothetical protein
LVGDFNDAAKAVIVAVDVADIIRMLAMGSR